MGRFQPRVLQGNGRASGGPPGGELIAQLGRRAALLALLALVTLGVFGMFVTYVRPNQVGIKESRLIPPRGIRSEILEGGKLRFLLPGQRIHRFPKDVQVLEFTRWPDGTPGQDSDRMRIEPALEINTSDGSIVVVDATVIYRIDDAFEAMRQAGPNRAYVESNILIPKAVAALKKNLGEMLAEDFYDVHKRTQRQAAAQAQIAAELADKGLQIEHVLIRQYYYNEAYQQQIEEKKIQDQLKFTRQSEGEAAKELAKKQEIEAQGKAIVAVEIERGNAEVVKIRAEAETYQRKREAEANLQVKLATATGTELENAAYQGGGSENLVGLEMARVLAGLDAIVVPSGGEGALNPLDLDKTLDMFDVKEQP